MNTIEEAEELRGQVLSMSAKDRPEIDDDDEFYVQELIGMQVRHNHKISSDTHCLEGHQIRTTVNKSCHQ